MAVEVCGGLLMLCVRACVRVCDTPKSWQVWGATAAAGIEGSCVPKGQGCVGSDSRVRLQSKYLT